MPRYSADVRELTVELVESGALTEAEAAQHVGASVSSVQKWRRQKRETGHLAHRPRRNGRVRVLEPFGKRIQALIKAQPDVELAELCARLEKDHGVKSNPSMMCRELKRLKLVLKKSRSTTANATLLGSNKRVRTTQTSKRRS